MIVALASLLLVASALLAPTAATWVIVISGVGGDAEHREGFVEVARSFINTGAAAVRRVAGADPLPG